MNHLPRIAVIKVCQQIPPGFVFRNVHILSSGLGVRFQLFSSVDEPILRFFYVAREGIDERIHALRRVNQG
ncbi:hypothetical protein A5636_05710 [Mycobacterium asiaticum]|uniref:Uncharacterized protein n=1 Tax=Mycobacterium asiaticum TaxID=1790 RepID=A0A1A3N508_MYCAS|nr:hypothetical protein A5636_05710 [Mycobacterium asiaticum]